jgi:arginyl-tRNA synthetase
MYPYLYDLFAPAFEAIAGEPCDPAIHRSQHADFQVDGALSLARKLGLSPREVAADVLAHVTAPGLSAVISGPGFINVTFSDASLAGFISSVAADTRLGVALVSVPEVVTIDYSSPNVAKELHVGHLRSTVIGDAAARVLSWLGHDVRRMNHVGDWGTPFGMLIEHLVDLGSTHELSIGDLDGFYKAARVKFDADSSFAERSRLRVVALQNGDENTRKLWHYLVAESERHFQLAYRKLDVTLSDQDYYGESFYNPMLVPVVDALNELGLLSESEGAQCVFPAGFTGRDGEPLPIIVQKRDGGFGYGATDLAAIRYRTQELKADRMLYVVGSPQRQHFAMVFRTATEAGWLTAPEQAVHVAFGSILGTDGKMLRTRSGETIKLIDLQNEAISRAAAIVAETSPYLSAEEQESVASAVGIGAVKYADLSNDRIKDYVFDWDRMLATTGDTAAYLQYSCARVNSIFRRGGVWVDPAAPVVFAHPSERALALELLGFPAVIETVASTLEFQKLARYLFTLAGTFSAFFRDCPVLKADTAQLQASRLVLCDLTRRTLSQGLDLLGITTPEQM